MAETPNPIDIYVGARVRTARLERGHSQTVMAAAAGTTFQQVQKYESGRNRISASRLLLIARFLEVPVASFFPDEPNPDLADVTLASIKHGAELSDLYGRLSPAKRNLLIGLARDLVSEPEVG